ncbi:GNAT family N-acetyltransferase [Shimia haliotis]|uniref:Ribosomal protein S18 acetylase RimI n=1 Tax=Shimia haliotis TaxID=1280847 RepID=A0A1I4DZL5_9RHOB|nr:GNAT family N-acetyltransferase [Shimia haliotis]SFK97546.1 Ribosomal protein S18 acetylase RimI [Shimia haliotis]
MIVRQAELRDVAQVSAFLEELVRLGKRTLPADEAYVRDVYVAHGDNISCVVAEDSGDLLGIQILKLAKEGNPYGTVPGWGIIGTHVNPKAARRGVGKRLFAVTRGAAVEAGLAKIEASIGAQSKEALSYYEAMGFRTFQEDGMRVNKVFEVGG